PDLCAVCGDPAIGFHYDVASCSGCRSFFRRTIKQQKDYKCKLESKCDISKKGEESRARCKACRLNSAIEAGMNPRALQSSDIDISSNRLAQMIILRQGESAGPSAPLVPLVKSPLPSIEERVKGLVDELVRTRQAYERMRASEFSPTPYEKYDMNKVFDGPCRMNEKWGHMLDDDHRIVTLTCKPPEELFFGRLKWWPLADCIYAIHYLKTFPFFEELTRQDQRLLSINTISTIATVSRSYYSMEQGSEVMVNPDGMRHNDPWLTMRDKHYDTVIIEAMNRLKITEEEHALIKAIVSTDYNTFISDSGRELMERYQATYRKALFSLVMSTRGIEGPQFFSEVMLMLSTLKNLTLWRKGANKHVYKYFQCTMHATKILEELLYEDPLLN
ncbi:hypothetical protein PMAYCL1PPCAC_28892, partial [Pristionchus mayeri]